MGIASLEGQCNESGNISVIESLMFTQSSLSISMSHSLVTDYPSPSSHRAAIERSKVFVELK